MVKRRKTLNDYMTRSANFERDGLIDEAVRELKAALRSVTDKAVVYRSLAELYRRAMQIDKAISAARKAIAASGDIRSRELLLELFLELNRFDEAIVEAKSILRISPHNLAARDVLGVAYLQKGMFEKALQVTNEMINLDPNSAVNHFKKAVLYQHKGDVGSAIHEFMRVLEMQPDIEMARRAEQAIESLDSAQLRNIVTLAIEDYIFRAKLIHDPESAAIERGYYLSYSGLNTLKQIQFDELPEIYSEWKQRYYH